ncbi:helix-turn-helix domain-containing protein [uncultured Sphingomonas sp.]|uniref:helix-turn-helix domain-containing protein n=1 Tax=uncultured Sphingomonas sp. TaxID=158754 RepID=UPI0035CA7415
MTIGERIEERRIAIGIKTQSALAERAGMRQSTLSGLIRKPYRWSPHLTRLARELATTVEYLTGEIDDPDEGAPPPAPEPQVVHVMLPVALPARPALTRMFLGHLRSLGDWQKMPEDDLAHELATLLPSGLGVLRGPLRFEQSDDVDDDDEPAEDLSNAAPAPRRARRT